MESFKAGGDNVVQISLEQLNQLSKSGTIQIPLEIFEQGGVVESEVEINGPSSSSQVTFVQGGKSVLADTSGPIEVIQLQGADAANLVWQIQNQANTETEEIVVPRKLAEIEEMIQKGTLKPGNSTVTQNELNAIATLQNLTANQGQNQYMDVIFDRGDNLDIVAEHQIIGGEEIIDNSQATESGVDRSGTGQRRNRHIQQLDYMSPQGQLTSEDDYYTETTYVTQSMSSKRKVQPKTQATLKSAKSYMSEKKRPYSGGGKTSQTYRYGLDKPFKCEECGATFSEKALKDRHYRILHSESRNYSCGICHRLFSKKESLKRHQEKCGNERKSTGSRYSKRERKPKVFTDHYQSSGDEDLEESDDDSYEYGDEKGNNDTEDSESEDYGSTETDESEEEDDDDDEDYEQTQGKREIQAIARNVEKWMKENKIYQGRKPRIKADPDDIDSEYGVPKDHLLDNMNHYQNVAKSVEDLMKNQNQFFDSDEEGESPYHCSVCGKNFAKRDYLKKHLIRHTGQKPYKCTRCHKSFTFKYGLKTHMMTHTRDMPFKCPVCGMKCIENSKLQIHMRRVHSDERPFECTQCDKKYPTKSELNNHILNAHTEIKPFPCGYCDKRFTHEAKLKRHELVHTGERPFTCSYCSKGFTQLGHLQIHERIHRGEKPYKCDECDRAFCDKVARDRHYKRLHGEKLKFQCPICLNLYRSKDGVRRHQQKTGCGMNDNSCAPTRTTASRRKIPPKKKGPKMKTVTSVGRGRKKAGRGRRGRGPGRRARREETPPTPIESESEEEDTLYISTNTTKRSTRNSPVKPVVSPQRQSPRRGRSRGGEEETKINVMSLVGKKRKRNDPLEKQMAETIKKLKRKVEEEKTNEDYYVIETDRVGQEDGGEEKSTENTNTKKTRTKVCEIVEETVEETLEVEEKDMSVAEVESEGDKVTMDVVEVDVGGGSMDDSTVSDHTYELSPRKTSPRKSSEGNKGTDQEDIMAAAHRDMLKPPDTSSASGEEQGTVEEEVIEEIVETEEVKFDFVDSEMDVVEEQVISQD